MNLLLIIPLVILMLLPIQSSFAQTSSVVTPTSGWYFGNFVEDVEKTLGYEFSCFCVRSAEELDTKHAFRQQELIEELDRQNLPIPLEFEQRRLEKLEQAQDIIQNKEDGIKTEKTNAISDAINRLKIVGELNEIRILLSQLDEVKNADEDTKRHFNQRVNDLDAWKNFCKGTFDIDDYNKDNDSLDRLGKLCPELDNMRNTFGLDVIKERLNYEG